MLCVGVGFTGAGEGVILWAPVGYRVKWEGGRRGEEGQAPHGVKMVF